jgi:hypothetical protein
VSANNPGVLLQSLLVDDLKDGEARRH